MTKPEYNGEFEYINLGPEKVKAMYESNNVNVDKKKIEVAYSFWKIKGGYASNFTKAGYVDRGDERKMLSVKNMKDLVCPETREKYVNSRGLLGGRGGDSILDEVIQDLI